MTRTDDPPPAGVEELAVDPATSTDPPRLATAPFMADGAFTDERSESQHEPPVLLRSVVKPVKKAKGSFIIVPGMSEVFGDGPVTTFSVRVEKGLPGEPEDFAAAVEEILGDPRSWAGEGDFAVQRVNRKADIHVFLAAPKTVDRLCEPFQTEGKVSCAKGNRAIINQNRWVLGAKSFGDDLETYRIYLINHEVGHTLKHDHVKCPRKGKKAPVMLQQTLGLKGCKANGWPANDPG